MKNKGKKHNHHMRAQKKTAKLSTFFKHIVKRELRISSLSLPILNHVHPFAMIFCSICLSPINGFVMDNTLKNKTRL
jgi:hypothetical protein